ncbi:sensor histidine kinase [Jiangella sp. DSM 45060]|uniref:sensor histidine kinase n=1 Tax=Jiangella sp. DSM 45060 TaxID=1798224 RepID=UPI00087D95F6|nr:sensor histidine kinase [Jiangella sp. DSM 45060]SDT49783.1 Signal transduction histidine kinase [Jiangella sp. DSM 45060]
MAAQGRRLTTDGGAPARSSVAELDAFWQRTTVAWHSVYLGLLGLLALIIGSSGNLSSDDRLTGLLAVTAMVVVYLLLGRRLLGTEEVGWQVIVQLAVSWGCLYLLLGTGIFDAYFLLFGLIPHIWVFLPTRWAIGATFVFLSGLAVIEIGRDGWTATAVRDVAPQVALQIGLSLLMGLFITHVFIQAEKRAELIDELERTRTELAQLEHSRGVLAERERLSHEIHDTLAQGFTSILTLAQAIEVALDRNPDAVRDRLALLEQTARDNLAEARALVSSLAPVSLQDASLPEAIERIAGRFADETGLEVSLQIDEAGPPLPANVEVVLLRATQEALTNVRKHAGARRVIVALRFRSGPPGAATVAVVDDGRGFRPGAAHDGYGLRGMRARVEQVGGLLEVVSAPDAGTTVRATVGLAALPQR